VGHLAELSYAKQLYSLTVSLGSSEYGWSGERLSEAFKNGYMATFGGRTRSGPIKLISLRTTVTGQRRAVEIDATGAGITGQLRKRKIVLDDGTHVAPVLERAALETDQEVQGPAVINQLDTTILLPSRTSARVLDNSSLLVRINV
jgi:N-methylhydantoinase A